MRVDPPLGRRVQTYPPPKGPVLSQRSSGPPPPVQPPSHTASGRFVNGISMSQGNLLLANELKATPRKGPLQSSAAGRWREHPLTSRPSPR